MLIPIKLAHGTEAMVSRATGGRKENLSLLLYLAAIGLAFVNSAVAAACYVIVAIMWLVPDRRIESRFSEPA